MEKQRPSFLIYKDSFEVLQELSDEDLGKVFRMIFEYTIDAVLPDKKDKNYIAFSFIKLHLDRDNKKYSDIVERNKSNGIKGGRPQKPKKPSGLNGNPKNPSEPKKPDIDIDIEIESDIESVKKIKSLNNITQYKNLIEKKQYFKNEKLKETFLDFIQTRIDSKKKPTEKAVELLVKKLGELSNKNPELAIRIIENSIESSWQSFFAIKKELPKDNHSYSRASRNKIL